MGVIYLLHFQRSYHHARHYLGYTDNLDARLAAHRAGRGSPLVAAAIADGIEFELAATWPADRHRERQLHRYHNTPRRLCPICRGTPDPADAAAQEAEAPSRVGDDRLVAALIDIGEPATLAIGAHLRRRHLPLFSSSHCQLELLAKADRVRKTTVLGELAWAAA